MSSLQHLKGEVSSREEVLEVGLVCWFFQLFNVKLCKKFVTLIWITSPLATLCTLTISYSMVNRVLGKTIIKVVTLEKFGNMLTHLIQSNKLVTVFSIQIVQTGGSHIFKRTNVV